MEENIAENSLVRDLLEAANLAVEQGYAVLRLAPGTKIPASGTHGLKDATRDTEEVARWYANGKAWNYGIATQGLFVVDPDVDNEHPVNEWYKQNAERLMDCPVVKTPRGGLHLYYRQPKDADLRNSASKIADKVDVRANGGYVVGPGSVVDGKPYRCLPDRELELFDSLLVVPDWLLELANSSKIIVSAKPTTQSGTIGKGQRNATLASLAGTMRSKGMTATAIEAALQAENTARCNPPLTQSEVSGIANSVARYEPTEPVEAEKPLRWQPFPLDCLSRSFRNYVSDVARVVQVDPAMAAGPALVAAAAAIGNSREIYLKNDWCEPSVLWLVVVAPSGSGKTPTANKIISPVRMQDDTAQDKNEEAFEQSKENSARYAIETEIWKKEAKKGSKDPPPHEPVQPLEVRFTVSDVTIERLVEILADNPRGVLCIRDELSGMLGGFDRYNKGGGAERAAYLSAWSVEPIQVDRKTGDRRSLRVRNPHVSIFGGIQPDLLHSVIDDKDVASGLPARFLWCHPPQPQQRWDCKGNIRKNHTKAYLKTFGYLYAMTPNVNEFGVESPIPLQLTNAARLIFGEFCDRNFARAVDLQGSFSGPWAKLRGYCGRIALVLHCLHAAEGGLSKGFEHKIDADTMRNAVTLTEWFGNEAERTFSLRSESPEERKIRELVNWIECKGGEVSVREISRGPRQYRGSQVAETMLQTLAAKGYGKWVEEPTSSQGGRPTRRFNLFSQTSNSGDGDGDKTDSKPEEKTCSVTVAADTAPISTPMMDPFDFDSYKD